MKRGRIPHHEDATARQQWARIQRDFVRLGQRDFKEIWTENPRLDGSGRDAGPLPPVRSAGPSVKPDRRKQ